ncbi:MAG: sulfur carrier protein ThiS [Hyphomicrobiaceae bacterium]
MSATAERNSSTIELVVNGQAMAAPPGTLARLIDELGYTGQKVATAVNGEFVPARARAETSLHAGDRVEIVAPRQGG